MIQVETIRVAIPLKKQFAISGGDASVKTNLLTILNNRYSGEAAPSVKYGPSLEKIETDLHKGISHLKRRKKLDMEALKAIGQYQIHPIARSALTAMVLHYVSGESKRYPWEVLDLGTPVGIRNSITISIDDPDKVVEEINSTDHKVIKIKMGGPHDAALVLKLEDVKDRELWIDANGGWEPAQAEEMIHHLSRVGVKIIEQPTSIDHITDWPHLKGKNEEIVLIVDEGLNSLDDYTKLSEHCDGVNIKMEKCGGIIEGSAIARQAREDGKKVMLGCMVESSVGIAQSVYMSSLADYHDLDSPQLLADDLARGITYDGETIQVDREIIGGPQLKRDIVDKYISK